MSICIKCKKELPDNAQYCLFCGKCQLDSQRNKKSRGNGQGTVYKRASGNWQAAKTIYKAGKRKVVTKGGFKTKKDAVNYLSELSLTKQKSTTISIAEIYQKLQPSFDKLSEKRRKTYESAYKRLADIELCDISELDLADLQSVINNIDGGFYTKRYVKDLFSKMYQYAFIDGKVDKDISSYVVLPSKGEREEKTIFTDTEVAQLWQAWNSGTEFAGYILILLYCALRPGELLSIRCDSVDFEKCVMYGGIKNNKGKYAPIFIVDKILPVVRHFADKSSTTLYEGYSTSFYREWRVFKEQMNFRKEIEPYCGRHSCSTVLAKANLPEATIMAITRHTKYDTTLQYTHIDTDSILKSMNAAFNSELGM